MAWWIYVTMLETGGMTALRSGVLGEQQTASELRKLAGFASTLDASPPSRSS